MFIGPKKVGLTVEEKVAVALDTCLIACKRALAAETARTIEQQNPDLVATLAAAVQVGDEAQQGVKKP